MLQGILRSRGVKMKNIIFNKFKDGKTSIVTMSFDDGNAKDAQLVQLFDKYGIKGTFHLVSAWDKLPVETYKGHEISCHGVNHRYMNLLPKSEQYNEWFDNRKELESYSGTIVRGASYPYGVVDDEIISVAETAGIVYSRTTKNTNWFSMPSDFMRWNPSCHFKDAAALVEPFLERANTWGTCLFYIWGHSYELRTDEDWANFEDICKKISGNDRIWYATNIEIYEYIMATKNLRFSADKTVCYNPNDIDVWISVDNETVKIPHGERVNL